MTESDKVCGVCFTSMGDLAAVELAAEINRVEDVIESDNDLWSDVSMSDGDENYRQQKTYKDKKGISVGSECLDCGAIICHECLIDWTITTIE